MRSAERSSATTSRARRRQLRGLAAGRRAQVGGALAGGDAQQARGNRGGRVLHPPLAFRISGQFRHGVAIDQAHGACRQHDSAQSFRPCGRIAAHGEVERRLAPVHERDGGRGLDAPVLLPARGEPWRRVDERVGGIAQFVARAGDVAQHGVGERGVGRGLRVGAHGAHGEVHRRMIGHVEEEQLRGADDERVFERAGLLGQPLLEKFRQRGADRAEAAQRGRDDRANQRAVAHVERVLASCRHIGCESFLERMAVAENVSERGGGCDARSKPRRRGRRRLGPLAAPAGLKRLPVLVQTRQLQASVKTNQRAGADSFYARGQPQGPRGCPRPEVSRSTPPFHGPGAASPPYSAA